MARLWNRFGTSSRSERGCLSGLAEVPPPSDLLHPYLSPAAALTHLWAGRTALHAGAVVLGDRAVLLLGRTTDGKSTTLAWLAAERGLPVLADDLTIIDEGAILPGPRCIDLRAPSAEAFADRWNGRLVRSQTRWRVRLPAVPAPKLVTAVSPWMVLMSSMATPSASAVSWMTVVSMLLPVEPPAM